MYNVNGRVEHSSECSKRSLSIASVLKGFSSFLYINGCKCDVDQMDYGREHGSQLPRPQQLTLAGSPTCADDDAQMPLKKPDATSAEQAHVDRYGPRGSDMRTRPAEDSGTIDSRRIFYFSEHDLCDHIKLRHFGYVILIIRLCSHRARRRSENAALILHWHSLIVQCFRSLTLSH